MRTHTGLTYCRVSNHIQVDSEKYNQDKTYQKRIDEKLIAQLKN